MPVRACATRALTRVIRVGVGAFLTACSRVPIRAGRAGGGLLGMPLGATETGLGAVTARGWGAGSHQLLAGLVGAACCPAHGLLMHQFCAAGLQARGGLWRAGGYVGSTGPAVGPSRPVSGPWRAIAGWERLRARCGPGRNDCFHCTTIQYCGAIQCTSLWASLWPSIRHSPGQACP